jgi:hypothetical protein
LLWRAVDDIAIYDRWFRLNCAGTWSLVTPSVARFKPPLALSLSLAATPSRRTGWRRATFEGLIHHTSDGYLEQCRSVRAGSDGDVPVSSLTAEEPIDWWRR